MAEQLGYGLSELDVAAARQLVQLSSVKEHDEYYFCEKYAFRKKEERNYAEASSENDKRSRDEEEGDDDRQAARKHQRFLPLVYIYKVTKPIAMA